ncbi:MAG: 4Fe-4S dicluster domain-containing protein [Chthoniobacterales bacterium]|nr:4Fe-4S dicluster domain-containing protein [Chthoniobacterales bacterium]
MNPDFMTETRREVFGNIAPWMQWVFFALMAASLGVLVWQVFRHFQQWRRGERGGFERSPRVWLERLIVYALAQKRVHKKSLGALLHGLLFSGFVVLTIGTTLLGIAHDGPYDFHHGWYYLFYELTMDVFGVAFIIGCLLAMYRRGFRRKPSLGHNWRDWFLLGVLLSLGITGFAVEALRMHYTQVTPWVAHWSTVGWLIDSTFLQGLSIGTAKTMHLMTWWLHTILVAGFFVTIPVDRFLHVITGPLNIATRPERPMGTLVPLTMEEVEKTGRTGVHDLNNFNQQQLLSLDACMECGRCEDACPAFASGKPLSPKKVVTDLRHLMSLGGGNVHDTIKDETLWACTMCQACVQECPVLIGHVDLISDMRRDLIGEGKLSGPPAKTLQQIGNQANPYGRPNSDRLAWAEGLDVPTAESNPDFEYLLWVGCAAAFDPRAQKVARATVQLLKEAGVNFAVLGKEETCTGDPARRIGDEFLFQERAQTNVETLNNHKVKKIVTPCPHCHNTLKNEYPQFGGQYEVQHHSSLLAELIGDGRLKEGSANDDPITLHDPCYLARVNNETEATRRVIGAPNDSNYREMPRHGKKTFCCGAGGGRMWFEEPPEQRVSNLRAQEAIATGAKTVATGCPFCLNMMTDGMASAQGGSEVKVLDIAEILLARSDANAKAGTREGAE